MGVVGAGDESAADVDVVVDDEAVVGVVVVVDVVVDLVDAIFGDLTAGAAAGVDVEATSALAALTGVG